MNLYNFGSSVFLLSDDEIECFLAVIENGSFSGAALALHKAQSSISYTIKKLEQKLGIEIFDRKTKDFIITDTAQTLYTKFINIVKINKEIFEFSNLVKNGIETKLNLALTAVTPTPLVIKALKKFNEKFPQVQIELLFTTCDEPLDYLGTNKVDFAITSSLINHEDFDRAQWHIVEFIAVAAHGHPATFPGISAEDLNEMTYLVVGGRDTLKKKQSQGMVTGGNVWNVTDFLVKKELLISGLGWGFIPRKIIERELEEGLLQPIRAKALVHKRLDLVRKKSKYKSLANIYLWKCLTEVIENKEQNFEPSSYNFINSNLN